MHAPPPRPIATPRLVPAWLLAAAMVACGQPRAESPRDADATVQISLFVTTLPSPDDAAEDGVPPMTSAEFADSLAVRLDETPGVTAWVASAESERPSLTLAVSTSARDGRIVVRSELQHPDSAHALWSSTYRRDFTAASQAVNEVAQEAAGAIFAFVGRNAVASRRTQP